MRAALASDLMESVPQKWAAEHDSLLTYFLLRDPLQILWQYPTAMVHRKKYGCSKLFILSRPLETNKDSLPREKRHFQEWRSNHMLLQCDKG